MAGRQTKSHRNKNILRDRPANLCFNYKREETKFQRLVNQNILDTYYLHPDRMHSMRQWLEFIVPIQWRRVFEIDCVSYKELVLEFFSTFFIRHDNSKNPTLVFRLRGSRQVISLREFALRLGIYTDDDIDLGLLGTWHFANAQQIFRFWRELVDHKNFRVSYITDSRYKILYQLISAALFGHKEIRGDLDNTDIQIMYSFVNNRYMCPALYIAQACEEKFLGNKEKPVICGGKIVTKLAESYGLLTTDFISSLEPIGRAHILEIITNKRLTDLDEPVHKSWVMLHDASPHDTPKEEIIPEKDHVKTTELVADKSVPIEQTNPLEFHPGTSSYHKGASSSVMKIPSFQALLESKEILSSQELNEFLDFPTPEMPQQLYLEDLFQEIGPSQTFYPAESSQHGEFTEPQSTPATEIPPIFEYSTPAAEISQTFKDLVHEVREMRKELSYLTVWLKSRFS